MTFFVCPHIVFVQTASSSCDDVERTVADVGDAGADVGDAGVCGPPPLRPGSGHEESHWLFINDSPASSPVAAIGTSVPAVSLEAHVNFFSHQAYMHMSNHTKLSH
jgi:hypothetical protein